MFPDLNPAPETLVCQTQSTKSTITPECGSAAECSGCKVTIEQSESHWHIGSDQQERVHEAARMLREPP
jgi:ferredoxin